MTTTPKTDPDSVPALDAAEALGIPLRGVISLAFGGHLEPTAAGGVTAASLARAVADRERALEGSAERAKARKRPS